MKIMANQSLTEYVSKMREMNIPELTIREQLLKSGWSEAQIQEAILPSAPTPHGMVTPPPVPRFSMWISFEYILLFITLWIWSGAMGGIWNYAIDKHIPDTLAKNSSYDFFSMFSGTILQGYLAAIIVSFPFFIALFISLNKVVESNPGVRNIKTRKILMYFTIVVNFLYMISMMITTLFGYLGATTSTRTLPHFLVSLIISGSICAFLLQEVREDRKQSI